jgi:hypothetical protein
MEEFARVPKEEIGDPQTPPCCNIALHNASLNKGENSVLRSVLEALMTPAPPPWSGALHRGHERASP